MQIVTMRDLKDTVKIEAMCHEKEEPVFVTKNGYRSLVVMDIKYYEKIMRDAYEAVMLAEGLEDIKAGRIEDGESAIKEIKEKYQETIK